MSLSAIFISLCDLIKSVTKGLTISDNFKRNDSHNINIGGSANGSKIGNTENCGNQNISNSVAAVSAKHIRDIKIVNQLANETAQRKKLYNFLFEDSVTLSQLSGIKIKNYELWISKLIESNSFNKLLKQKLKDQDEIEFFCDFVDAFIDKHLSKKILEGSGDFKQSKISLENSLVSQGRSKARIENYLCLLSSVCDELANDISLSTVPFPKEYYVDIKEILNHAARTFSN